MRQIPADPHCRENFVLTYKIVGELIKRHYAADRLRIMSYIDKEKGYYVIYLAQDPVNPLSTAFGYFNASLGNFRKADGSNIYYYFYDYKSGKSLEEIIDEIEKIAGLPLPGKNGDAPVKPDDPYIVSVQILINLIEQMPHLKNDFAVENEICPYFGPYSKVPDNRLWFELHNTVKGYQEVAKDRCIYDYFAVGTGAPLGPVYKSVGFIGNDAMLYLPGKEPLNLVELYIENNSYLESAKVALAQMNLQE